LQAAPSFEAFGRYLEATNPFALWAQAVQMFWMPWLGETPRLVAPNQRANPSQQIGSSEERR